MSTVIIAWMNEDGSLTHNRDEIINNVRKVVSTWKNSPEFLSRIDAEWNNIFAEAEKKTGA